LASTTQFKKLSAVVDDCFVASNPNELVEGVSNAGKVTFFQNFAETKVVFGDVNTTLLGEYIWLSKDGLPGSGQQPIIAASYYVSPTQRSINLYKVRDNDFNLFLWQKDALVISTESISSLKFESGVFMYLENSTLQALKMCTEN